MRRTDQLKPWKPGQSGNPKGRPKGSKDKLNEAFISKLTADFEANGIVAISTVREKDPGTYLRVIASVLPKDMTIAVEKSVRQLDDDTLADIALGSRDGASEEAGGATEHSPVH